MDDTTAAILDKKTEGWVTGLRLAGLYLHDQEDLKQRVLEIGGSSKHIAEYLVSEVLSRQNPEIAAYLLETSILDRFCAPFCRDVHSRGVERRNSDHDSDAQRFIQWIAEANLFVIPLDDQSYWFRYHHLFREFLHARLRKQTNSDKIAGLHMKASNWFAENGLIDEAMRHALACGNKQAAVRLVVENRYYLMNSAQFFRLYQWLRLLPEHTVTNTPLLATTKAFMSLEHGQTSDLYSFTEQARRMRETSPSESADSKMLSGEIAVLQSVMDLILGQSDSALTNAKNALDLLPAQALFPRSMAMGTMAGSYQVKGEYSRGSNLLREALLEPVWPLSIQAKMWFYLCILNFMQINASDLRYSGRKCLEITGQGRFTHTRSGVRYFLGAVHYLRNELAEAKRYLSDLMRNREVSHSTYVAHASGILGFIHLAEGCPEEAEHIIKWVNEDFWETQERYALATKEALMVELALRQGQIDEARRLSIGVDFDLQPPVWFLYVPQLTPNKLLLALSTDRSLKEAYSRIVELDEQMDRINRKNVRIDVLALLALVCHKSGEEAAALEHLRAALDLAEPGIFIRNFVDLGAPMRDLLQRLNQAHPGHKYTQQVLEACRAEAGSSPPSGPDAKKGSRLSGQVPVPMLTQRETEILSLLTEGLSNKEIAARLHIAPETVKTHLQNIYEKLNAKGRLDALNVARKLGLIPNS